MPTPWTSDWTVLIAKLRRKKAFITIHNDMNKPDWWGSIVTYVYMRTVFRFTLLLADRIIIVNPDWQTAFKETKQLYLPYKDKVSTFPNGVDTALFSPTSSPPQEAQSILFVSILDKHHGFKGFEYLLGAMPTILRDFPEVLLDVIGDGSLRQEYIERTNQLGLSESVKFHGAKSQSELVEYYQHANVFVLPSTEIEGFGIVLLEAMACGVAVVSTNIVGVAKQIEQNNTGIIIEPRNTESLTQAIVHLLKNPLMAREMGSNGRDLALKSYSWQHVSNQVSTLYDEAIK